MPDTRLRPKISRARHAVALDRRGLLSQPQARSIKKCEVATTTPFSSWAFSKFLLDLKTEGRSEGELETNKTKQLVATQVATSPQLSRQHPSGRKTIRASILHPKIRVGANRERSQTPPIRRLTGLLHRDTRLLAALRLQKPRGSSRKLDPILNSEFAQQSGNVKFHRPHRNVQHGCDLFIRFVAQNRVQNLFLPRTQRPRTCNRPPFLQQRLRPRYQPFHQNALRRNHHLEVSRFLSPHKALHRQQSRDPFYCRFQPCVRLRPKLRYAGRLVAENKQIRGLILHPFLFLSN